MAQKRVTFDVAMALKEAGYPQEDCDEYLNEYGAIDAYLGHNTARPTYLDVWLWLWREKGRELSLNYDRDFKNWDSWIKGMDAPSIGNDPEEAIEVAIKYIVDNNLIKYEQV